ncbi:MAG: nicotinamide-nucleotide amidohydrolase family protein [Planctomycetota bacterium]|jgi:nicotinamide-nucleotide amidase
MGEAHETRPSLALLSIGDELLAGAHPDLNAPYLARTFGQLGLPVERTALLGDDRAALAAMLGELLAHHRLVITSGGLGPTLDDVTRHAAADALGVELEHREDAWQQVLAWYSERGAVPPEVNRRQALFPVGSQVLFNPAGTAPAILGRHPNGALLACLPGPPRELQRVTRDSLLPALNGDLLGALPEQSRSVWTLSHLSESVFAEGVGAWMDRDARPAMSVSAKEGLLVVAVRDSGDGAVERVARRGAELVERFESHVLFAGERSAAEEVIARYTAAGKRLALVESLTGGEVCARLTDVPGASAVLAEGRVVYSPVAKHRLAGVSQAELDRDGVVSEATALGLVRGPARQGVADVVISLTGAAGPDPEQDGTPPGHVAFGVAVGGASWSLMRSFPPKPRARVRRFATHTALELALRALDGTLELSGATRAQG